MKKITEKNIINLHLVFENEFAKTLDYSLYFLISYLHDDLLDLIDLNEIIKIDFLEYKEYHYEGRTI